MSSPLNFTRFMIAVLAFTLCGGPQILAAQQSPDPAAAQQSSASQAESAQQPSAEEPQPAEQTPGAGSTQESATPDPSKGPLAPAQTQLPNAPSSSRDQQQTSSEQTTAPKPSRPPEAPIGVGAAQAGRVSGGAASRPAGTAIAPAKQRQVRSLLIKVGAIAAGAAAFGVVYGLSRSSPSKPPGASSATTPTGTTQP